MEFRKQKPIYLQIADSLCEQILEGEWLPGGRMPSVRDVAANLGVNPNTVLRSFEHLQGLGIISNKRGIGYFVDDDADGRIYDMNRREFLEDELPLILYKMELYAITQDEIDQASKKLDK